MLCERCQQQQATVHMQQVMNGVRKEIHLCQACSLQQFDIPINFETLFHELLDSFLSMKETDKQSSVVSQTSGVKCPSCGMTHEGFKTHGKLGCAECYRTFSKELETILKNVQGSTHHEGKFPRRSGVVMYQKREVDKMRGMLNRAVAEENFELAAELRDRIHAMEGANA